jgi:hypothetical protein
MTATSIAAGPKADTPISLPNNLSCSAPRLDRGGDAWLQQLEARSEAKCVERLEQIVAALLEMSPTFIMHWNDHGVWKCLRRFDGIVSVHRKMKGATRLRRADKQ